MLLRAAWHLIRMRFLGSSGCIPCRLSTADGGAESETSAPGQRMNAPRNEAVPDGSPAAVTDPTQGETTDDVAGGRRPAALTSRDARPTDGQPANGQPANGQPAVGALPDAALPAGHRDAGQADDQRRGGLPKIIHFDALARCGDEIWIENEGQIYRLRKTRQGKLILTK
jgi:hemin uptake protein HemP